MEMSEKKKENSHTWLTNDMNPGWNEYWSWEFSLPKIQLENQLKFLKF